MTSQSMSMQTAMEQCFQRMAAMEQSLQAAAHNITRLRRQVFSLEAAEAVRRDGRTIDAPIEFSAQYGEDTIIWDLLGRPVRGFFVEVGAFDGKSFSGSLALEQMGWRGLLVEPIPERAAECKSNRPNSAVIHAALGGPDAQGETSFTVTEDQHGGMLSYRAQPTPGHRRELDQMKAKERTVTVPFTNLANLLEGRTDRVDAAIIDVEGGEIDVIRGMNLEKFRPRVMVIEDSRFDQETALSKFMQKTAYLQVATIGCNRVFVHKDEREIFDRIPTLG